MPLPVPLAALNELDRDEFIDLLGDVFERAPWIAEAVVGKGPFPSVTALHQAMLAELVAAPADRLTRFLNDHPDLVGPTMCGQILTAESTREQTSAGLDRLTAEQGALLAEANAQYRARFGFPFIICVLRHSRDSIFAELERRLGGDASEERRAALAEIARITALRLVRKVTGPGIPEVYGRLSTHLLDMTRGHPAAGVPIELYLLSQDGSADLVAAARSNVDGRTDAPLIAKRPVPNGTYELRFSVGGYFADQYHPPFLGVVPVRFATAEPEGHYHIPLLFTPWSYSAYRGS
jgi:2-oxo-4-hydroxy-4-carboxy-5-ureidoimidazoline decarboxylase